MLYKEVRLRKDDRSDSWIVSLVYSAAYTVSLKDGPILFKESAYR